MLAQSRQGQRHILSKKQQRLNKQTLNRLKKSSPSPIKTVQFNNEDQEESTQKTILHSPPKNDKGINKEYGSFLKQQMTLQRLNGDDQLAKSRKLDQQNASYLKQKYPFGFEGVKACQDVIEKYKASNYLINRGMLQEFERKAEEYRRNRMNKYKKPQQDQQTLSQMRFTEPFQNYMSVPYQRMQLKKITQKNEQQDIQKKRSEEDRRIKKEIDKNSRRKKRQQGCLQREKENLIKVGNMLRQIDHKIKQNSSKLSSELRDFKEYLRQNDEEAKYKKVNQKRLQSIIEKIQRNSSSCSKIPVIMYNNIIEPNLRYNQSTFLAPRINRSDYKPKYNQIRQVAQILRKNQNRLKMLTQDSSFVNQIKTNISF